MRSAKVISMVSLVLTLLSCTLWFCRTFVLELVYRSGIVDLHSGMASTGVLLAVSFIVGLVAFILSMIARRFEVPELARVDSLAFHSCCFSFSYVCTFVAAFLFACF